MGATNSKGVYYSPFSGKQYATTPGGGRTLRHAGSARQRKCQAKPPYAEARGFALTVIYGVPASLLDRYPPTVYSLQQAREDIAACSAGQVLPHHARVVRFDKVVRKQDPRVYALTQYHGYSARDFKDGKLLELLPYSAKNAQIDITAFAKTGKPYYRVIKQTSTVLDVQRGTARDWRHRGFDDRYRYDLYDPGAKRQKLRELGSRTGLRFDASRYPTRGQGSQRVRVVPCTDLPAMCRAGDTNFVFLDPDPTSGPAAAVARAAERLAKRRDLARHSQRMARLARRMKALDPASDKYKLLASQRRELQRLWKEGKTRGWRGLGKPAPGGTAPGGTAPDTPAPGTPAPGGNAPGTPVAEDARLRRLLASY